MRAVAGAPELPRRLAGVTLLIAAAAAAGAAFGWSAYALDPIALPLVVLAAGALALGMWRLEWGVALLLLLTPFAENAELSDLGSARLRLSLILWAGVLVVLEAGRLLRREGRIDAPPLSRAAPAFVAAALVSTAVASDEAAAFGKLLVLAGSVSLFAIVALSLRDWRRLEIVLAAAIVAGIVVSAHALYQRATGDLSRVGFLDGSGTVEYRVTSFFSHPNQLAGFLCVLIPISVALARHFTRRWLRAAAIVLVPLALLAVLFTYSRGALVGLLALSLLSARSPRMWPVLGAGVTAILIIAPGVWRDRIADAGSLETPEIATRVDIWSAAVDGFGQRPLLGWGLNNFPDAYVSLERTGRSFLGAGGFDVPETAHNLYLNVLTEQGLLGLAALIVLGVGVVRLIAELWRSSDPRTRALGWGLMGMLLVLAAHNFFDVTFVDPKTSVLVWTVLGVGAAAARAGPQRGDAR